MSETRVTFGQRVGVGLATAGLVGSLASVAFERQPETTLAKIEPPAPAVLSRFFDLEAAHDVVTLNCDDPDARLQVTRTPDRKVQTFVVKVQEGDEVDALQLHVFPPQSDLRYVDWRKGAGVVTRQELESAEGTTLAIGAASLDIAMQPDGSFLFDANCATAQR